jgi:NAD-dependent SIR2 family protein deacetylase
VKEAAAALEPATDEVDTLVSFFRAHRKVTILTGAGCSTASGIPDYRDDDGRWKHREPMRFAQFVREARNRQRYWAQSFSGWERISNARPNHAHVALARLEAQGRIHTLVTQNVDMLHQRAGSERVIDLHGVLHRVRCLTCGQSMARGDFQTQLRDANPDWDAGVQRLAPYGDATLSRSDFESFVVPSCRCGGALKPDVVFFGESVPKPRVAKAYRAVEESDALLVVGSSLMVYSGYRFAVSASKRGTPVGILNRGRTRADHLAGMRLRGHCAELLGAAADALG